MKNDAFIVARTPQELKDKLQYIADCFESNLSSAMRMLIEEKYESMKI